MFNLEKQIAAWRRQMRAAGIQSPVPLDELENHLREEIEREIKCGSNSDAQEIFDQAARKIGQPGQLKTEFTKTGGARKSDAWRSHLPGFILLCAIIPLSAYALFKKDLSLVWRLTGFANLIVVILAVLGCRQINRSLPIISNKRIRTAIGILFGLFGMAGMIVFMNFILPNFSFTEGQLTVVVLWSLTVMATFGAVWAGLEEAARRETAMPD